MRGRDARYSALALPVLLFLPLLYFAGYFPFVRLIDSGEFYYYVATRCFAARLIRGGFLPLWSPLSLCGAPLAADVSWSAFYPLNFPYLVLQPEAAANLVLILHHSLAGIGAFLYMRRLGASAAGAFFGAVTYSYSGFIVSHRGHNLFQNSAAWFPLTLLGFWGASVYFRRGFIVLGAAAFSMQLLCDFQPVLYTMISGMLLLVFTFFTRDRTAPWPRCAVTFPLILGIGFALAAFTFLPSLELIRNSVRAAMTYQVFKSYSFHPFLFILLLFPHAFGGFSASATVPAYWGPWNLAEMGSGYCGIAALALAILAAVVLSRTNRAVAFHILLACAGLLLVMGKYNPLYRLLYHVPVYNLLKVPARNWIICNIAFSVLAAFGLDALLGRAASVPPARVRRDIRRVAGGLLLILAACGLAVGYFPSFLRAWEFPSPLIPLNQISPRLLRHLEGFTLQSPSFYLPILVGGAGLCVLLALARAPRNKLLLALLFAAAWTDLCISDVRQPPSRDEVRSLLDAGRYPPAVKELLARGAGGHEFRVCPFRPGHDSPGNSLRALNSLFYGISSSTGYGPFISQRYAGVTGTDCSGLTPLSTVENRPLLSMMNVRYILCGKGLRPSLDSLADADGAPLYRAVWENPNQVLYENPGCLPRAWCVARLRIVPSFKDACALIRDRSSGFDPAEEAVLEADRLQGPIGPGRGEARVARFEPNRIEIRCSSPSPNLLVLSENFYPGWRAFVDGKQERIYAVNGMLRGVFVPEGDHTVQFHYRPTSFMLGLACSGLGATIIACLCLYTILTRRG